LADDEVRELVCRALDGDGVAVGRLVDRYRERVFGLCYRMLGHRHDAEDALQETFVRAVRSLRQWDSSREFTPWLLTIAANRCRTLAANRAKRKVGSADVELLADARPDAAGGRQLAEEVGRALDELRNEHRQAFVLFHCEQLEYVEIAAALDVPLGTVKTWVHRARSELATRLRERGVVEGEMNAMR
jgi:RNA polymerase sigma-70 factor (ECF subfamily)